MWFGLWALLVTIPSSFLQMIGHRFDPTARNFKKWSSIWGRTILRGIGIRAVVTEQAPLDPSRPYVFISNHQCLLDILALAGWLPYPFGFVAKIELSRIPFLGFAVRHSASVYIDRSDPRASLESLQRAGERIRGGNSVLVFAEGSRSYAPMLAPFKKGAFMIALEAGVPLVPVTVIDAYRLMDERRRVARPGVLHIAVGEPISLEGKRRKDIPEIMALAERRIAGALPVPGGLPAPDRFPVD